MNNDLAYLIGYLSCDGGYVKNKKWPFMMVSSIEEYIIKDFQTTFCPDRSIYNVGVKSSKKVNAVNSVFELRFPREMNNLFKEKGIFCYKKDRRIVGISKKFLLPYFAATVDADGFISITHRKDCRTPRLRFFITHRSELFLADLQRVLDEYFSINTTLRQHGDKNCFRLQGQNTEQNKPFLKEVLPFLRNKKKIHLLTSYLSRYYV